MRDHALQPFTRLASERLTFARAARRTRRANARQPNAAITGNVDRVAVEDGADLDDFGPDDPLLVRSGCDRRKAENAQNLQTPPRFQ